MALKNLKNIYPLPEGWKGDEKAFGVRLNDMFRYILGGNVLKGMFLLKEYTKTKNIATGSYEYFTKTDFGISAVDGYTPVGIVNFQSSTHWCYFVRVNINETNVIYVHNASGADRDCTVTLTVLYVRDWFIADD